jgi:hypothetical protein
MLSEDDGLIVGACSWDLLLSEILDSVSLPPCVFVRPGDCLLYPLGPLRTTGFLKCMNRKNAGIECVTS